MIIDCSIIICTFNGSKRLSKVFAALSKLNDEYCKELIVVNNASTDNTDEIVEGLIPELLGFTSALQVFEPLPGLTHARAKGVKTANGRILVFCDDDNYPEPDFITNMMKTFEQQHDVGIVGANAIAIAEVPLPDWFYVNQRAYACGPQQKQSMITTGKHPVWGAGVGIRKDVANYVFNEQHPFLYNDRTGKDLSGGGDNEMCYRAWLLNYNTYYDEKIVLKHEMSPSRLSKEYLDKLLKSWGKGNHFKNAYFRMYVVHVKSPAMRFFFFVWQLCQWLVTFINQNKAKRIHARQFLYYLTGWNWLADDVTRSIRNYYLFAKSIVKT